MSRYRNELSSLFAELRDRYGERDDSVQQVKHELEAIEAIESKHQDLFARGRDQLFSRTRPVRRNWEWYSSLLHSSARPSLLNADLRAGKQSSTR